MHPEYIRNAIDGQARAMIDAYLALPLGAKPSCPYFNNRRRKIKSQLRVLKGKGSPAEIAEEAEIAAKYARIDIASLSTDELKEFLIAEDLGIDCSGFAYHVLNSLAQERTGKSIQKFVRSKRTGFMGGLIARLRPAENMGVSTFADPMNSAVIMASDAQPGDIVTFIGTGKDKTYNHMLVITGVESIEGSADADTRLSYAHSYAWPSDGATGHGVREGDIIVHGTGDTDDLLKGAWKEKGATGIDNYTHQSALSAKEVSIRRLKFLK